MKNTSSPAKDSKRLKALKVRFNAKALDWYHKPHLGKEGVRRVTSKAHYRFLAGPMLKAKWPGEIGVMSFDAACKILRRHHDFPAYKKEAGQRRWLSEVIKNVCRAPNVTRLSPRLILFDTLAADHGGVNAILKHQDDVAKSTRKSQSRASQRQRDNAKFRLSEAHRQIVINVKSKALTQSPNPPHTPLEGPTGPKSGFAATRPKRPSGASASRAKSSKTTPTLISLSPQRGKPDFGVERKPAPFRQDWTNPYFDPRTNCAARRICGTIEVTEDDIRVLKRTTPDLRYLTLKSLSPGATLETLWAAHHLLTNRKKNTVKRPAGWLVWAEKGIRQGKIRYAGEVFRQSFSQHGGSR